MDLTILIAFMICGLIAFQFWHLRGIAELAVDYAKKYCDKHNLQYISLARTKTKFKAYKGKLDWHISYELAFSSDGEREYLGTLVCHGKHLVSVELPVYRVTD